MKKILAILSMISFIILQSAAQNPKDFSFAKSFKISTPAEIDISTNDGFIHAFAENIDEVRVFFIVRKNNQVVDMDLEELEEHLNVEVQSGSDELSIAIKRKEADWIQNWKNRYHVSLHILTPKKTACNLRSSDGDIELYGFSGDQTCRTSDGDIMVEDIDGNVYTKTSDGDISVHGIDGNLETRTSDGDISAKQIRGESIFKTSDGKIMIQGLLGDVEAITSDGDITMENVSGRHNVRTSDGNIQFENMKGALSAQTSDGNIRGDFDSLIDRLYLKTSDGDISVTVPNGLGMDLRLKGEDILTRLDNFSGDTSDNLIEGTIRGGGIEIELVSSGGDVTLLYK